MFFEVEMDFPAAFPPPSRSVVDVCFALLLVNENIKSPHELSSRRHSSKQANKQSKATQRSADWLTRSGKFHN